MAIYTLPDIINGGGRQINASSLADAEAQAQAQGWWNPGAGTFGIDSLPPDQRAAAHGGQAPPPPLYTLPVTDPRFQPSGSPTANPMAAVSAAAAANLIPSGPGGSYLVPIATLVAQGVPIDQAVARVVASASPSAPQAAGAAGPLSGAQTAATQTAQPAGAATGAAAAAGLSQIGETLSSPVNIGGASVPLYAVVAGLVGAYVLLGRRR